MKIYITLLVALFSLSSFAQIQQAPDYTDDNRRVYWFDVTIKDVRDNTTGLTTPNVYRMGTRVQYGSAMKYDQYLWNGLSNGSKIAIGPFNTQEQAKKANRVYKIDKARQDTLVTNDNGTYYWYLVTIKKSKRLKSYQFERIPARVTSGSLIDFLNLMDASLPVNKLVIGPFENELEAENSKRIFRLEE